MKILLKILVIAVLFVAVAAVGLVYYIRNGDYKAIIEQEVADSTGYELTIAGELDVDFLPNLGITLNDVRLTNPGLRRELLSTSAVVLRVNFRELFNGRVLVEELLANDFHINYTVNADGSTIWDIDNAATASTSSDSGGNSDLSALTVDRISINNTSIDYQDMAAGSRYQIDNFNLESRDTNLAGRPFALEIDFDFENNGMSAPVPMSLRSNVLVDLNAGNINFNNVAFSVTPLLVQGNISLVNFNESPQYSGNLAAESFDLRGLLQTLALAPEPEGVSAPGLATEQMAAFQMQFSGNAAEATMPSLSLNLGGTEVEARGSVRFATDLAPMNVSYSLIGGDIDLTPLLGGEEEEAPASPASNTNNAPASDTELPVELLSAMNLLGSISLSSLTYNEMRFENINLYTNIEDSVLDLELAPVSAFTGSLQGSLRLDGSSNPPALTTQFSTDAINLVQLAPSISRFNSVTGFLNVESEHNATGSSVNTLLESLNGSTSFSISDNSVDIGLIKQVFTAIAALSPNGESIQQWPDVIRFNEMGGYITLEEGLEVNQELKVRMDNFDITGNGGVSLAEGNFNYSFLFTVLGDPFTQTIPINDLYHDIPWPVTCNAAFTDPLSQYCRPDFNQVRQLFTQIGTNAARRRLEEVISDQVPENIQDTARGLLRNLFNN